MFWKTSDKTEEDDQKTEKNDQENERHDWRKYLNKNNDQTVDGRDFNVFFTQNQRFFKTKIKQEDEIDNIN